jgi:hypothetical protein
LEPKISRTILFLNCYRKNLSQITKNLSIFNPKIVIKASDPEQKLPRIPDTDSGAPDPDFLSIPDPGVKKAPNPGSDPDPQHWVNFQSSTSNGKMR